MRNKDFKRNRSTKSVTHFKESFIFEVILDSWYGLRMTKVRKVQFVCSTRSRIARAIIRIVIAINVLSLESSEFNLLLYVYYPSRKLQI